MNDLLKALREEQRFQIIMDGLKQHRPVVPSFRPGKEQDELIEKIKFQTGMQEGFDLLFKLLVGK